MAIRLSFEIDRNIRDAIEKHARESGVDTSSAMQDLLIKGISAENSGKKFDSEYLKAQKNEEYHEIYVNIKEIKEQVSELTAEVRLMHHLLESGWKPNETFVARRVRTWDQFKSSAMTVIMKAVSVFMPKSAEAKQITKLRLHERK
jgi:hypothetical protein